MNKELSHRSHELKALGWNQEDIERYEDLWDYSQRWGLINLERDDRQFLKKAEKLLPKIQNKKISIKKSIEEKSYYLWLDFYLNETKAFNETNLPKNKYSVWTLIIEEELKLLKELKPIMGLPDTLKAKGLFVNRNNLIKKAFENYEALNNDNLFDFDGMINSPEKDVSKSWKSMVEKDPKAGEKYPIIEKENVEEFRSIIKIDLDSFMRENYPSLKENL